MTTVAPTPQPGSMRDQLMSILRPRRWIIALIVVFIVAGALLELAPPLLIKRLVDEHLTPRVPDGVGLLAVLYVVAVAGVQAIGFLTNYMTAYASQGALRDLRVRLFSHLQRLPFSYYDRTPLGDIISRCTADVDTVDTLFSSGVAGLISDLVRLVTVSIAMVALSPPLAAVSALVVPLLLWITNWFRRNIRDAERKNRLAIGQMNSDLQETLGGVEVIRAFGREWVFVARFRRTMLKVLLAFNRSTLFSSLYPPVMAILSTAIIALLLWSGAQSALTGFGISLGTLTAFILLFQRFFDPITALGDEWQTVQSALSGAERIFQVLTLPLEQQSSAAQGDFAAPAKSGIEFGAVTFGYAPEQPVLHGVSFFVQPGEHVALVGRTGAGKSSILHLLGGLYTPWSGRLCVAGLDPRTVPEEDRRRLIGVVPQHVQLFSGTVLENLTLADPSIPLEAIQHAAQVAGADTFIRSLPQGYDTLINNGAGAGVTLSSGQRQLLSLARALVYNPPVLLFDEATSAIDSASEANFRAALSRETARHERAILTVAHRLSTAREADRVIVLDMGRILETGTPADLVRCGGRFATLLELEAAGWDWRDVPLYV
jgi:ATP-binding cassette, subfamily B, multidrug efflux pump